MLHRRTISLVALAITVLLGSAPGAEAQSAWNSVTLTWTTPGDDGMVGNATAFDVRYSTSAINASNFASAQRWTGTPTPAAPGTQQTTTITGLQPNTTYWFAIKTSDDASNWAGISNVVSITTASAPDNVRPAPIALNVDSVTDTTATLKWSAVGDDSLTGTAASYDIRYSASPITAANWGSASQVSGEPAPASPGTQQTYMVKGLSRQVTYYFAMKVKDESGNESALSNVPSATTPDTMSPAAITNLTASFVWIGWTAAARPHATEVERR